MMFTTEMIQLFAVVLEKDSRQVTEMLLRQGGIEFINISELQGKRTGDLTTFDPEVSLAEISDLRKRIEGFLYASGIIPAAPKETDVSKRVPVDIQEENNHLDKITSGRESLKQRQRTIQQEILKLEDISRRVQYYGLGVSDFALPEKHSFISMQIGKLPVSNVKQLEDETRDLPSLSIAIGREEEMAHHLLISMKRDSEQINKILANIGWAKIELPGELQSVKKDVSKEASIKLKALAAEQKKLEVEANTIVGKEEKRLKEVWINLRVNELLYKIQANFKSSSRTVIFTGWLPSSNKEEMTEEIQKACGDRCYLEWNRAGSTDAIDDEVPVQFNNPKMLAPFQMLVSNFSIPKYGTIDPTPFVMPLYLCMFGLMFADIGQGLVLAILGILGVSSFKKNKQKEGLLNLSWLIIWCGFSSVFFGVLFGSVFGVVIFEPLWFDFHGVVAGHPAGNSAIDNVYDILRITLYFGISVIALGLLFNWINIIRAAEWADLFFDKGGVLGGWIYAGGIYTAFYMVTHNYKGFPSGMGLFLLAGLPSLLLFIKEPYHHFKNRAQQPDKKFNLLTILNFLMEWVVELLEIFSGYLSNTLSFMRVAGLGIAHVCLMISFFTLADMTSGIFSVLILIFGNILVIGLEGLTAGIQALRLNYYEFFTKFFHGTGKLFTPISLSSSRK